MSFMQQGQKCLGSAEEILFYNWSMAEQKNLNIPAA
jgi:hypothetical protein